MLLVLSLLISISLIVLSVFICYLWISFCFSLVYKISFVKGMKITKEEFKKILNAIIGK